MFHLHQCAVLDRNFQKARSSLDFYEKALRYHIREEEDILLPLYRQRAVEVRGGDPDLFCLEHKKMFELLGRVRLRLSRITRDEGDYLDTLSLLDDETRYKQFTDHHFLREERILFPEMDRLTMEKEKNALLRILSFSLKEEDLRGD